MQTVRRLLRMLAGRLPAVQLALLERPRDLRDGVNRALVLAAVAAAAVAPVFLGRGGGDLTEGAGASFTEQMERLEELEQRQADGDESAALAEQIELLREQTRLGYLPRDGDAARIGGQAPDFRLLTLAGEPFRMSDAEGPVILNFWASWCQPCIEEMPDFQLVHEQFGGRLTLIGVNDGEDPATAQEFRGRTGVQYVVLLDPATQLTDGPYRLIGRPTTYYINADGIIHDVRVGIHSLEEMRRLAAELVGGEAAEQTAAAEEDGYTEQVLNLIESGRANFGAARSLLDAWADNPRLFDDPGWQRNITAQTRVWEALQAQAEALKAPAALAALHGGVAAALAAITVAGQLIRGAVDAADAAELGAARTLLQDGVEQFELAAADLEQALQPG